MATVEVARRYLRPGACWPPDTALPMIDPVATTGDSEIGSGFFKELRRRRVFRVAALYIVAAWVVIQVAEVAFPGLGIPEAAIKYVFIGAFVGFPLALIFGWRYDLTSQGIVRTAAATGAEADVDIPLSRADYAILAVLLSVIGVVIYGVVDQVLEFESTADRAEAEREPPRNSVAVLPFVNASDDPSNEFFSDGISEDILGLLARISGLTVAARTSSFSFKAQSIDAGTIARRLNVKYIVEGSVRKSGDEVRIAAQLVEAEEGYLLWHETYDVTLDDIFTVQDQIATKIVHALTQRIAGADFPGIVSGGVRTSDLEAYEEFLLGRHYWAKRGEENVRKSIALFERVLDRDPRYAEAWAALASAYVVLPAYTRGVARQASERAAAAAARQALALDSTIGEAYAVLAAIDTANRDWFSTQNNYERALKFAPNDTTTLMWYAEFLAMMGRNQDSLAHLRRAMELDPLSATVSGVRGWVHMMVGEADRASFYLEESWEQGLHVMFIWFGLFLAKIEAAEFERAEDWLDKKPVGTGVEADRAYLAARRERSAEAARHAVEVIAHALEVDEIWPYLACAYYIGIGAVEHAYGIVDEATRSYDPRLLWLPGGTRFREDPRFAELAERLGLVEYWRERGWPDFCEPVGDGVACH